MYMEDRIQVRSKKYKKLQHRSLLVLLTIKERWSSSIVCVNGIEFTSKAMLVWRKESSARLNAIQLPRPSQNSFIESLIVKVRNGCLVQHWFRLLEKAKWKIDKWREQCNNARSHSFLNYLPWRYWSEGCLNWNFDSASGINSGERSERFHHHFDWFLYTLAVVSLLPIDK